MANSPTIDDFYNDMHNILQAYSTNDRSGLEQLYLDSETDAAIDRIRARKGNPYYNPTPMEIKDNIPFFSGNRWNVMIGHINDAGIEGIMKGIRYRYKDLLTDPLVADRLSTIEQFLKNNRNVNVSDLKPELIDSDREEDRILNAIALNKQKRSTKQQDDFAELLKLFSKDSNLPSLPRNIDRYNRIGKYEREYAEALKAEKTDKEKALAAMQENERKAKELNGVDPYDWGTRVGNKLLQDPEFQRKARLL